MKGKQEGHLWLIKGISFTEETDFGPCMTTLFPGLIDVKWLIRSLGEEQVHRMIKKKVLVSKRPEGSG